MSIYIDHHGEDDWWDHDRQSIQSSRKTHLPLGRSAPHYPNKNEAKMLRRIMAETGLTKEQVRANPKYRKMLSQAQDRGEVVDQEKVAERRRKTEVIRQIEQGHARKAAEVKEASIKAFKKYKKTPDYIMDILRSEHGND